jgi:hypothetical protein
MACYDSCEAWEGKEDEKPPAPNMQNSVRGVWQQYWPGVK